jgi:hypothetical protein
MKRIIATATAESLHWHAASRAEWLRRVYDSNHGSVRLVNSTVSERRHVDLFMKFSRREQTFNRGEDEAEPSQRTISHVSPLAMSLLERKAGDVVRAGRGDAEIVAIR